MGYFANGTEGCSYEAKWCANCVHFENCAILVTHHLHNYEEANNEKSILHELIPIDDKGNNLKCEMFLRHEDVVQQIEDGCHCGLCGQVFDSIAERTVHMENCK